MQEALVDDVVHRQQLDRRDAERREVGDRLVRGEPRIGAAQILAHAGVQLREAAHVQLVDHRLVPRRLELPVALPVEARVDHDAARHRRRVVAGIGARSSSPGTYGCTFATSQRTPPSITLA